MEPRFQSSFIPKGPAATAPIPGRSGKKTSNTTFLGFVGMVIFIISLLAAAGVFGYTYYLKYRISSLTADLETARQDLQYDTIQELIKLDGRIVSVRELIDSHVVLSPVFEFLESSTVRNVSFTELTYSSQEDKLALNMTGKARGYAALALQADIFNSNEYLKDVTFSDIALNQDGDITFSVGATIDRNMLSYREKVNNLFPTSTEQSVQASTTTIELGSPEASALPSSSSTPAASGGAAPVPGETQ